MNAGQMRKPLLKSADMNRITHCSRASWARMEPEFLHPQRIQLNSRLCVWVASEVERWQKAIEAGCSDDEIRALIKRMVAERPKPDEVLSRPMQ